MGTLEVDASALPHRIVGQAPDAGNQHVGFRRAARAPLTVDRILVLGIDDREC
jgi:hypothetical protein